MCSSTLSWGRILMGVMALKLLFRYGKSCLPLNIRDENVVHLVENKMMETVQPAAEVERALNNPIGSLSLGAVIQEKRPQQLAVVVTDISRPVPYREVLPCLMQQIHNAGLEKDRITFIIATGAHRPNTLDENREAFGQFTENYTFINHDCDKGLVSLGFLKDGTELLLNRLVAEAEMVLTIGAVMPHNLAGFSGGPKLILPGVAGRKTIESNHRMMKDPGVGPGEISGNPIQKQIWEGTERVGVDFALNLVLNQENQILKAFAGSLKSSWEEGCFFCQEAYRCNLPDPEQVVIAGAGGYPRDLNLYQSVKALTNAARLTKPGGTIVLVAKCQDGMGDPLFEEWMSGVKEPEEVLGRFKDQGFTLGPHKAFMLCELLKNKEVILVSDLDRPDTRVPLLKTFTRWERAERELVKKHGSNYRAIILPLAGLVFPLTGQLHPAGIV